MVARTILDTIAPTTVIDPRSPPRVGGQRNVRAAIAAPAADAGTLLRLRRDVQQAELAVAAAEARDRAAAERVAWWSRCAQAWAKRVASVLRKRKRADSRIAARQRTPLTLPARSAAAATSSARIAADRRAVALTATLTALSQSTSAIAGAQRVLVDRALLQARNAIAAVHSATRATSPLPVVATLSGADPSTGTPHRHGHPAACSPACNARHTHDHVHVHASDTSEVRGMMATLAAVPAAVLGMSEHSGGRGMDDGQ